MGRGSKLFWLLAAGIALQAAGCARAWAQPMPTPSPAALKFEAPKPETRPSPGSKVIRGTVRSVKFDGLQSIDPAVANDVAGIKVGEDFSRERLENSINALRRWGVFSKVEVLVQYEGPSVDLVYDLEEGYIIKDVKIKGNYPLLDREVRRTLFLNPGEIYDKTRLVEQLDRLDKLYAKEGYFETTVLAVEDYNEADHEVTLYFKIQKGKTFRIRDVAVEGNTALKPKRIRHIIYSFFHYKPKSIKKDLEKIRGIYRKKGYVRARVRLQDEAYDYDARKVDLGVAVRQGKRVFVEFEGNYRFKSSELRKQLTMIEDGDYDDYTLDASKANLIGFYKLRGFEDVQVTWAKEKVDDDNFLVTFQIDEGPQRVVKTIEFEGTKELSDGKLKDVMLTKEKSLGDNGYFIEPLFEADLKSLNDYFKKEGFLDAKIESWDKSFNEIGDRMILTIKVDEKVKNTVEQLSFEGLSKEQEEEWVSKLLCRPGEAYSPSRAQQDVESLLVQLSNTGYPYAQVVPEATKLGDDRWNLRFKVDPGKKVTIGRLLFVGNSLTREKVIRKNLRFKEGSVFSAQNLLQSQINLRRLGVFDRVAVETLGLANKEEVVHALISVQEKKTKILDLEVGFNTDTKFTGKAIFNKLNLWGTGKNANIKLQAGQEISRFELNYVDPRLRGTSLQLLIGAFVGFEKRPFFENFQTGVFTSLFKDFSPNLSAYGRMQFDAVNFDESKTVVSQLQPGESATDATRLATTVGVTYDQRDNFGNPTRGYYLNGSVTFTNQFIQSSGSYLTTQATLGQWWTPFKRRVTVANALRVSKIFPFPGGINTVPVDDRLYLGGDDTVRGFCQDCLLETGGLFALVHNLELQVTVFNNFQVVAFLDTGIVIDSMDQFNLTNLRHAAGPGVRYMTPVGPIRLEYGFKLDPQPGESAGRLTFSFGYFF